MIATGIEEGVPADWPGIHVGFRAIVDGIPRSPTLEQLREAADTLSQLADDVLDLLKSHVKTSNLDSNEAHSEPHIKNSNPNSFIDLEPACEKGRAAGTSPDQQPPRGGEGGYPLGMVLQACGDLADYAKDGQISNWRDFLATAAVVRPMLGISPSAWEEAQRVMGEVQAAIVVACILERSATINSAGGYLRGLTAKAGAGEFSLGPILMAQMNARLKKTKMRA
jgi:replication initiation protein RepC